MKVLALFLLLAAPALAQSNEDLKKIFDLCNQHVRTLNINEGQTMPFVVSDPVTGQLIQKMRPMPPRMVTTYDPGWEQCQGVFDEYNRRDANAQLNSFVDKALGR